jgi:hypothetical protein
MLDRSAKFPVTCADWPLRDTVASTFTPRQSRAGFEGRAIDAPFGLAFRIVEGHAFGEHAGGTHAAEEEREN